MRDFFLILPDKIREIKKKQRKGKLIPSRSLFLSRVHFLFSISYVRKMLIAVNKFLAQKEKRIIINFIIRISVRIIIYIVITCNKINLLAKNQYAL